MSAKHARGGYRLTMKLACTLATTNIVLEHFPHNAFYQAMLQHGGGVADPVWQATDQANHHFAGPQFATPVSDLNRTTAEDYL